LEFCLQVWLPTLQLQTSLLWIWLHTLHSLLLLTTLLHTSPNHHLSHLLALNSPPSSLDHPCHISKDCFHNHLSWCTLRRSSFSFLFKMTSLSF
jgi:hypothetical protein